MRQPRTCPYPTPSPEQGWVIALVLVVLAVTLGLTLASASMVLFHMKSSRAYSRIVQNAFLSTRDGRELSHRLSLLDAPEGWDHIHFSTELIDVGIEDIRTYSWRVAVREPYRGIPRHDLAPSQRPHILVIVDDSVSMNASSGHDYRDESLYLRSDAGGIVHVSDCSEVPDTHACPEGIYFSGRWGNSNERAAAMNGLYGAMPTWALAFSRARSLIDSLDQCEIAVMSGSRGLIHHFTGNWGETMQALDALHPTSSRASLAETLYQASAIFPEPCVSGRHILLVTAGISVNDGHLPAWLRDYDHDDNPDDIAFDGEGSHCLDDVSAYARSLGIAVHVMGPDTDFLRDVASKGGGRFMPGRDDLTPEGTTVTVPLMIRPDLSLVLSNSRACLHPTWLSAETGMHGRLNVMNPWELLPCPDLPVSGTAFTIAPDSSSDCLYVSTSRDRIIRIDLSKRDISWLLKDLGGALYIRGDLLLSGPDRQGIITCISRDPHPVWRQQGTCMDASDSIAYVGTGSTVQAHTLADGFLVFAFDTNHRITIVRYDPVTGTIMAGTADGLLYLFDQALELTGIIDTGMNEAILDISSFTMRKTTHILALGRTCLAGCTLNDLQWTASLDPGEPMGMAVMDGRAYVSVWTGEPPCLGMETGTTVLHEFDVLTGERFGSEVLCAGAAFGPSLDLDHAFMKFVSASGEILDKDISSLLGIQPCPLGKKLIRQLE
ncbi:MAG TPA: hypothetical protein PLT09_00940 [Deltaproteobacteria bacterium]|nr:hypothetical protein [Deltaproteobacteria bacterium]HPR53825.1 hypothetical protein [Deltaproteobacteria bacterium]HXK45975.1 hypothetical protein [Deltaproteobacteria bacterium]